MASTFAKIVREQGIDRRDVRSRRLVGQSLFVLAHRMRTNTLRASAKRSFWQRLLRALSRLIGKRVV